MIHGILITIADGEDIMGTEDTMDTVDITMDTGMDIITVTTMGIGTAIITIARMEAIFIMVRAILLRRQTVHHTLLSEKNM